MVQEVAVELVLLELEKAINLEVQKKLKLLRLNLEVERLVLQPLLQQQLLLLKCNLVVEEMEELLK